MPSDEATISRIQSALKVVYSRKGVYTQFNQGTFTLDVIESGDQNSPKLAELLGEFDGQYVHIQAHTDGNPNVGTGVAEGESYARRGSQAYNALKYRCRRMTSTMGHTTEAMNRSNTDKQAVFRVAAKESVELIRNTRKRMNFYALGDGSGLFSTVAASSGWNDSTKKLTVTLAHINRFKVGMEIIPRSKTTGALPTGWATVSANGTVEPKRGEITAIDTSAGALTLRYHDQAVISMGATAADGFGVYLGDQQNKVPFGLDIACSTVNPSNHGFDPSATLPVDEVNVSKGFGGLDRNTAGNEWWKAAPTLDVANSAILIRSHIEATELELIERDDMLRDTNDVMCLSRGKPWQQIVHQAENSQVTEERLNVTGGKYKLLRWGIFTFGWDYEVEPNTMFMFVPKYAFRMILTPWRFETKGGSMWTQQQSPLNRPTSVWQANLESEQQMVWASCRANKKLINIDES